MSLYESLRATASGLLVDYGAQLTFTRKAQGAYDPATGSATETSTTYALYGVVDTYRTAEIDGSRVLSTDRKVMVQAGGTAPAVGDTVTIDSQVAQVVEVMPLSPAGTAVAYELQVRL